MCKSRESASLRWSELTSQWRITRQETFILNIHDCFPSSSFAIETTDPPKLPWINWSKQFSFCAVICVAKNLFITLANLFSVILQWTSQIKSLALLLFQFWTFTYFGPHPRFFRISFQTTFCNPCLHEALCTCIISIGLSNLTILTLIFFHFVTIRIFN